MKLTMYVGCEFAPGQRTGFDFNVELAEDEMLSSQCLFLNHEDSQIIVKGEES